MAAARTKEEEVGARERERAVSAELWQSQVAVAVEREKVLSAELEGALIRVAEAEERARHAAHGGAVESAVESRAAAQRLASLEKAEAERLASTRKEAEAKTKAMQAGDDGSSIREEEEPADENVVKRYKRRLDDAESRALAAKTDALTFERRNKWLQNRVEELQRQLAHRFEATIPSLSCRGSWCIAHRNRRDMRRQRHTSEMT
jgi:hypothetical protein